MISIIIFNFVGRSVVQQCYNLKLLPKVFNQKTHVQSQSVMKVYVTHRKRAFFSLFGIVFADAFGDCLMWLGDILWLLKLVYARTPDEYSTAQKVI